MVARPRKLCHFEWVTEGGGCLVRTIGRGGVPALLLLASTWLSPHLLVFSCFPCTETGQGIVHALTDLSSPGMTSGNGNSASSITGTAPQNGENKPPQAIVKPQILTHVIEGFVIQEGAEPFPVRTTSFPLFFFFLNKYTLDVY